MKHRRLLLLSVLIVALLAGGCGLWVWQAKQQYALNRQLITALLHNDTKKALVLVNAGADPNTPLNASSAPSLQVLFAQLLHRSPAPLINNPTAFLIACGATVSIPEHSDSWLMPTASDEQLVQTMLAHGANSNARVKPNRRGDKTALLLAIDRDKPGVAQLLVEHSANVNTPSPEGRTALMQATHKHLPDLVRLLLAHGAAVNVQDPLGETALHRAVCGKIDWETLLELQRYGANPNQRSKAGFTPLMLAQLQHRSDIVAVLHRGEK